jgi:hypothetical protein
MVFLNNIGVAAHNFSVMNKPNELLCKLKNTRTKKRKKKSQLLKQEQLSARFASPAAAAYLSHLYFSPL